MGAGEEREAEDQALLEAAIESFLRSHRDDLGAFEGLLRMDQPPQMMLAI